MARIVSEERLVELSRELNEEGISSYANYDQLKADGGLDKRIEEKNIPAFLKEETTAYLDLLYAPAPYYYKKMKMEEITRDRFREGSEYLIASYCDDVLAYRNLPRLLYSIIKKLDIEKYKYIRMEDLISKVNATFDLENKYDDRRQQIVCEILYKSLNDKYSKYDNSKLRYDDEEFFSIWAEEYTCSCELSYINGNENCDTSRIVWVARDHGDGYGFDVLSYDIKTNREKLIEVKSGGSDNFYLTPNEVAVMRNCKFKNADYHVYKWTYQDGLRVPYLTKYKYDSDLDVLVDSSGNQFELYKTKVYDKKDGKYKDAFGVKLREKEKILEIK